MLSEDGRRKSGPYLSAMAPGGAVFAAAGLGELPGRAADVVLDPTLAAGRFSRADAALALASAAVVALDLFPLAALEEAAREFGGSHAAANLAAISAGAELATQAKGVVMVPSATENPSPAPRLAPEPLYEVLVNEEERFVLWPADREVPYSPDGWRDTGKRGTEPECLAFIAAHDDAEA